MPKVVLDISDADYKSITEDYMSYADTESGRVYKAIKEGTVLPDNPTNGDMIEAVFAIKEIHAMAVTIFVVLDDGKELEFNREWWFSPYKVREGTVLPESYKEECPLTEGEIFNLLTALIDNMEDEEIARVTSGNSDYPYVVGRIDK